MGSNRIRRPFDIATPVKVRCADQPPGNIADEANYKGGTVTG